MKNKQWLIYLLLFIWGICSAQLGILLLGLSADFIESMMETGWIAGLAAALSGFLLRSFYQRHLHQHHRLALYGWVVVMVLFSHILYPTITVVQAASLSGFQNFPAFNNLKDATDTWGLFFIMSIIFGFIPNTVFGVVLTESLLALKKRKNGYD